MRATALLTALLLLPLAGCLGPSAATAGGVTPEARAIARDWHAEAVLERVMGIEVGQLPPQVALALSAAGNRTPEASLLQAGDANVGDGRAAAWLFAFRTADRELLLVVDASGKEVARHETAAGGPRPTALGDPAIDSDRAMRLAASANATFAAVRARAQVAGLVLVQTQRGPAWGLMVAPGFLDGRNATTAVVDATSGNVTTGRGAGDLGWAGGDGGVAQAPYFQRANQTFVDTETGTQRGSLTVLQPDGGQPFALREAGHAELRIKFGLPNGLPPTKATATVSGPDGGKVEVSFTPSPGGSNTGVMGFVNPSPGEYRVQVHLDTGVAQDYTLDWCALGTRPTAQNDSSACSGQ